MQIVKTLEQQAIALFGLSKHRLTGRKHFAVLLRHTMCLVLNRRGWSLNKIAPHMGYKDHTTVMHAVNKMAERTSYDPAYAAKVDTLAAYREPPLRIAPPPYVGGAAGPRPPPPPPPHAAGHDGRGRCLAR